jgi:H+/Cl- antiporter ClcA
MHDARRWLRPGSAMNEHALLVAGGAAGIAAAFNAPLAGVVFAIEELSRKLESRNSGLIIAAIVLAGLIGVSAFGNYAYFGSMVVPTLDWSVFLPALLVIICCGAFGGLFSRLLAASLTGSPDRFSDYRARYPIRFAAAGGFVIAIIGLVTHGATFGAGGEEVRAMLTGEADISKLYFLLKLIATWITTWCGVPGGIFAPSLSIGAGIGHDVAQLTLSVDNQLALPALIAMGMAGFLAAVTQAPLTSFIIVMEMLDGRPMVLSLMASAMIASLISRLISRPLYTTLSEHMISKVTGQPVTPSKHD